MLVWMAERRTAAGTHVTLAAPRRVADEGASAEQGDLLGTICHDLRDPLSAILMGTKFLLQRIPGIEAGAEPIAPGTAAQLRRMAEAVERSARRMNDVIADFHDLSRWEGHRVALDTYPVAVATLLAHAAERAPRAVTLEAVDPSLEVVADRARVAQALAKLIDNAAHAAGASGAITLGAAREGSHARLAVRDAGGGVDPIVLEHLFDHRWLTARAARNGTGLGLAIVRLIVDAHGGRLTVETEPGRGTTASFTLPLAGSTTAGAPSARGASKT
jgi:signal transduction histidine kinase